MARTAKFSIENGEIFSYRLKWREQRHFFLIEWNSEKTKNIYRQRLEWQFFYKKTMRIAIFLTLNKIER